MNSARFNHAPILAIAVCAALTPLSALAENITYTVDPTRSSLTVSGTFAGNALQSEPGAPGSLTTSYAGTISADRDFLADTLQITGGDVSAQTNGTHSPIGISFGIGSSDPLACYAFTTVSGFAPPSTGSVGAILGVSLSPTTPVITSPENFDSALLATAISLTEFDIVSTNPDISGFFFPISGSFSLASGTAYLADADGTETLAIPVGADFGYLADGQPLQVHFSGTIVATTSIPEPGSLAVLASSCAFFILRRRSQRTTHSVTKRRGRNGDAASFS